LNPKVGIMFLMVKDMITTFDFMSLGPVHPELHLVTSNYVKGSYMGASVTWDVLGPME
jgi:hypothetical protein